MGAVPSFASTQKILNDLEGLPETDGLAECEIDVMGAIPGFTSTEIGLNNLKNLPETDGLAECEIDMMGAVPDFAASQKILNNLIALIQTGTFAGRIIDIQKIHDRADRINPDLFIPPLEGTERAAMPVMADRHRDHDVRAHGFVTLRQNGDILGRGTLFVSNGKRSVNGGHYLHEII